MKDLQIKSTGTTFSNGRLETPIVRVMGEGYTSPRIVKVGNDLEKALEIILHVQDDFNLPRLRGDQLNSLLEGLFFGSFWAK